MKASFDKAAPNYDIAFTNSNIGKMQRASVYKQLSIQLQGLHNILEINCGTGEDAIWLAHQNFNITATDISAKMIDVAKNKGNFENLNFLTADIKNLADSFSQQKFDLIFSNFGGLNCLSKAELKQFFIDAKSILSEKGKLVLVIMPKNTLWEQFYFLTKAQFSSMFRRKKESIVVDVDGEKVPTFYFNPKVIVNLAKNDFEVVNIKPIGVFVPPSYLESFFKNKIRVLQFLKKLDDIVADWSSLSKYADHYIITLQKR